MIVSGSSLVAASRHTAVRQVAEHSRVEAWIGKPAQARAEADTPAAGPTRQNPDPFAGMLDAIQRDRLQASPEPDTGPGPEPLIDRLKQTRPKVLMEFNCAVHDHSTDIILIHLRVSAPP
ncbi:MAG: hypothetical protein ACOCZK_02505 [Planctomycetota bacterium]